MHATRALVSGVARQCWSAFMSHAVCQPRFLEESQKEHSVVGGGVCDEVSREQHSSDICHGFNRVTTTFLIIHTYHARL